MTDKHATPRRRLQVRQATMQDVPAIFALTDLVYGHGYGHSMEMLRGQQAHFPQGQFVAELDGEIVGYCATFRTTAEVALKPHTWAGITGAGLASRHDPEGEWLYGMEVAVHPAQRSKRIGQRLYDARKKLCTRLKLRGIVFAGRLPGLARARRRYSGAAAYVQAVVDRQQRDPTLGFQLRNGFEVIGVLPAYEPHDHESLGFAAHLVWRNPDLHDQPDVPHASGGLPVPTSVRVASVQYQQRRITSFEEFAHQVEYFTDIAADYSADFVVFPEMLTLQLLSIENIELTPGDTIRRLSEWTPQVRELFAALAVRYNINIIGGSHPTLMADGDIHNVSYICLRDGSTYEQEKLHPTPSERNVWGITGGDTARVIHTDCGPIGVMICYDSEFPEVARHLVDQGALILFTPFCTDVREGYLRVRYCCQARAVENQCYVVMSGNVGNLPGVHNFDIQYGQSCILSPCDFPFARDGIAADSTPNIETVLFADLNLDNIARARNSGSVTNLKDRRYDLYETRWLRRKPAPELALGNATQHADDA